MASSDIEKLAVFDSRIIQSRPKYAVEKGALSLTNAPFNAIAATPSQHTYNIYVPSENVFVDRALEWSSTVQLTFQAAIDAGLAPLPGGTPLAQAGRDFALSAFPLNSLCSTLTATINDTTSVINSQDVLKEVLRLTDYSKNRLQRTCPTMLDKYQSYNDAFGANNNPLGGYQDATGYAEVPNGAFGNLVFTDPAGNALGSTWSPVLYAPAFAGANYQSLNGVPVMPNAWSAVPAYPVGSLVVSAGSIWSAVAPVVGVAPAAPAWNNLGAVTGPFQIYIQFRSTEKLVLSPFVFADCHEWDTGLFGINNIQLIMNLQSNISRVIRSTTRAGVTISGVAYGATPFANSRVNVQFLTPSLDVPLPPKSVVPYMEFPRYITQPVTIGAGERRQIQSQTITLPQIPDLLICYVKPTTYNATEGDWYFPVANSFDGAAAPLSVNFDNFSGLLSSVTAEQLYAMSIKNGLDMDWNAWSGVAHSSAALAAPARIPLVGGFLVLKPSQDITLQAGQAPSLVGNFTLQLNLEVVNRTAAPRDAQLYIITANSGFFESIRGSSRIIKGVLSEQDIISAPMAPQAPTRAALDRLVGGAGMFSSLANVLSKAKDIYHATKPAVSAIKGMLPEGRARQALGAVGYGMEGGEGFGAGQHGGAIGAGKQRKGLAARLM